MEEERRRVEEEKKRIEEERIKIEEEIQEKEAVKIENKEYQTMLVKNVPLKTFYSEYIQKKYKSSTDNSFPTRNTKTKVFGGDENEENKKIIIIR